jgi:hypothetical protein
MNNGFNHSTRDQLRRLAQVAAMVGISIRSTCWDASATAQPLKDRDAVHLTMAAFDLSVAIQSGQPAVQAIQQQSACVVQQRTEQFSQRPQQGRPQRHFPWRTGVTWETFLYPQAVLILSLDSSRTRRPHLPFRPAATLL